jgi:hypothetical protein
MHLQQVGKHGNVVHSLLSDYGTGALRICRFTPAENELKIITFDTSQGTLVEGTKLIPDRKRHQFTIRLKLQKKSSQAVVSE